MVFTKQKLHDVPGPPQTPTFDELHSSGDSGARSEASPVADDQTECNSSLYSANPRPNPAHHRHLPGYHQEKHLMKSYKIFWLKVVGAGDNAAKSVRALP